MKDKFGYERGACVNCPECEEFLSTEGETRCTRCGCVPVAHEKVVIPKENPPEEDESSDISEMSSVEPPSHLPVIVSQPLQDNKPLVVANTCSYPHCSSDVHFDLNTGIEYAYCSQHYGMQGDMIMIDLTTEDEQEMILPSVNSATGPHSEVMIIDDDNPDIVFQTVSFKCALVECYNPCYVDESGTLYECCGYAHAKEYQRRISLQTAQGQNIVMSDSGNNDGAIAIGGVLPTCALSDCNNPCHIDDNGTVHECCGFSHAMEHQRRLSLLKQDIGQNVVKGVTHCLLPECTNLTWPFQNYCGRSHADIGIKRGLTVPSAVVSSDDPNSCIYPNCGKPKYTGQDGVVHPYCGKTHADLAKSLGIFPTASSTDDQCQLEGCTRPKLQEGARIHDYCSMEHAKKDEPNRQVLTPLAKVREFLKKYESHLKVISLEENDHAKPGGALFKKFKDKMMSLPKDQRKTCLAFHGTPVTNIQSICQNGYNPALRRGQACGPGEYFAITPATSMGYCGGGKKMLLNELLLGQEGTHHTKHGDIIVMKDPIHDLPRFVITFQ